MSDRDIIWFLGIGFGFTAGFSLGHLRGQIAGMLWYKEHVAQPPADCRTAAGDAT